MRFWLLDKTALVQSSQIPNPIVTQLPSFPPPSLPLYELCPTPWGGRDISIFNNITQQFVYQPGTDNTPYTTLTATAMGQPYIYARTVVLNVDNELRKSMAAQKHELRFRQQRRDFWTVDSSDFVAAGTNYRRILQINGLFQTLFMGFRSDARTKQNRYTDILPSYGQWISNLSLNVNGQDRIYPWTPKKFTTLANNTQLNRDVNIALYYLIFGISPDNEPSGTCNLSRCQKAVTNLTFNPVPPDPMTGTNTTYAFVLGLAWNILDINNGIAELRFPD